MKTSCAFCGCATTLEEAQDQYWEPNFWAGTVEISQPVCPNCHHHLAYNEEFGDCQTRQPITQPVYVVGFYTDTKADNFYFLAPPDQEMVDHLAHYRPGATIVHSIMNP